MFVHGIDDDVDAFFPADEEARAKKKVGCERGTAAAKKDRGTFTTHFPNPFVPFIYGADDVDALFPADDEARAKITVESERESPPGIPQGVARDERDRSPDRLFVAQDDDGGERVVRTSTLSSGPYAGLQSAKKRVREAVAPQSSFGPAKKPAKTSSGLKYA